jgi:tetratricopeptide (TPR) repeat protein
MTNTNLVLIDNYFRGRLSALETTHFEQQILTDQDFAGEVVFYCGTMELLKEKASREKTERFKRIYKGNAPVRTMRKWWPYAAAAAVVAGIVFLAVGYLRSSSIQETADRYIAEQMSIVSVQMNSGTDSLQVARQWYNESRLAETGQLLDRLLQANPQNDGALLLAGFVSLRLSDYDKAIAYFSTLEKMPLYANPGKFHHALTLIKRDLDEDREHAKALLQQVIDENLEGKELAADWLNRL